MNLPRRHLVAVLALGALTLALFGGALFGDATRVLGNGQTDAQQQFVAWREFGFRELRAGNLALWNPHVYGGAPFFGGFQAALLYPLNTLFLVLPVERAINWTIALHVWLLGGLTYAWLLFRRLHPAASWVGAATAMFCGAHILHVFAGHLSNLCTMAWTPLIFLAIDGVFAAAAEAQAPAWRSARAWRWVLAGAAAVAMQVLAGHPQYVAFTAVAAGLYSALRLIGTRRALHVAGLLACIYLAGAALSAVQLLPGMEAAAETVRSRKLPFGFVAMFSFPPENLLTLIAPGFFGDMTDQPYWGRCQLWEMSLFIGLTGLVMAVYALPGGGLRRQWRELTLFGVLLLLALGVHTPLFRILYDTVPGFSSFRGLSKYVWPADLILIAVSASGFDRLLRQPVDRRFALGAALLAAVLIAAGLGVMGADWAAVMQRELATGESYLSPALYERPSFIAKAHDFAAGTLFVAAFTSLVLGALLAGARRAPRLVVAVLAFAVLELGVFAVRSLDTFDSATAVSPHVRATLPDPPGEERIIDPVNPHGAMIIGAFDLWGGDPGVVLRYAEFMTWSQGGRATQATQHLSFDQLVPLYAMLRLRYAFEVAGRSVRVVESPHPPMERLALVTRYQVQTGRDAVFDALRAASFDPRREVVLEQEPEPRPVESASPGTASIVASSTDWLEISAELATPAVLLITDVYTPSWRAVALPGSSQERYELLPANYVLRAVPLAAGRHRLRVEYAPRSLPIGAWVSGIAWAGLLIAGVASSARPGRTRTRRVLSGSG